MKLISGWYLFFFFAKKIIYNHHLAVLHVPRKKVSSQNKISSNNKWSH